MIFELENVGFHYPETTATAALGRLNLRIPKNRRIALLGANGSGKSTLLRILNGLAFPQSGTVRFCGELLNEQRLADSKFSSNFRRRVGLVFQNPDVQLFNPTVFDEVAFGPLQLGWSKEKILESLDSTLASLGITHLRERASHRLSGGEKKRVALASTLILDPEVLLLDEPTAGLDPQSRSWMIDYLLDCAGSRTVITATHDLNVLEEIADECFVFEQGQLAAEAAPCELLQDVALLHRVGLLHSHRHGHPGGVVHSHPHVHRLESPNHDHSHF